MALEPIVIDGQIIQALPYPDAVQILSYTGTADTSDAFSAGTNLIRIVSTTACHVKVAAGPTATTSDMYLPADVVDHIVVAEGQKISAIQASAGGDLSVSEYSIGN